MRGSAKMGDFEPISRCISETMQDRAKVAIGSPTRLFDWQQNQQNEPQNGGFSDVFAVLGCGSHFKSELRRSS